MGHVGSEQVSKRLHRVADDLRWHTTRVVTVGKVSRPALDVLLSRAHQVIAVGLTPGPQADGWPSRTPMNGDPAGGKGGTGQSRTEVAAIAEISSAGKHDGDVAADTAEKVMKHLRNAVDELESADRLIQGFDRLRSPKDRAGAPQCYVAEVMYRLEFDELWAEPVLKTDEKMRCTDFAGVLPRPWPEKRAVCQFVYEFTRRHGRLPTKIEMEARLEKAVIRVRAS